MGKEGGWVGRERDEVSGRTTATGKGEKHGKGCIRDIKETGTLGQ